jgi:hypothetical protein
MTSLHMQGGCICENPPGLRLDTNNVELAATIAPRPLLMVSATGDWTKETPTVEYPAMQRLYAFAGAADRLHAVQFDAPHNYNRDSREAVYAWMARWLKDAPADVRIEEQSFQPEAAPDALVFYGRPMPASAVTAAQLTSAWIEAAARQLASADRKVRESALLHALGLERRVDAGTAGPRGKTVVFAGDDRDLQAALSRAGFSVRLVSETPFDGDAAAKIPHFDTYNRTRASQRVADIARALDQAPGSALVAAADAGLPAILALAIVPARRAVIDVDGFDLGSDAAFVERLYIPGLRRAGDLQTAVTMAATPLVIHNAGDRFTLEGPRIERRKLTAAQILALLRSSSFVSRVTTSPASVSSAATVK